MLLSLISCLTFWIKDSLILILLQCDKIVLRVVCFSFTCLSSRTGKKNRRGNEKRRKETRSKNKKIVRVCVAKEWGG